MHTTYLSHSLLWDEQFKIKLGGDCCELSDKVALVSIQLYCGTDDCHLKQAWECGLHRCRYRNVAYIAQSLRWVGAWSCCLRTDRCCLVEYTPGLGEEEEGGMLCFHWAQWPLQCTADDRKYPVCSERGWMVNGEWWGRRGQRAHLFWYVKLL